MITCDEALDQYYREHIHKKAVAVTRALYAIDALNKGFKGVPLSSVDIPMCRDYVDSRGASEATARRELGVLRAAAGHAVKWKRITLADMPSIELPPDSAPRRIWLFKDELANLLDSAEANDARVYRFVQLAYHTASRRAAIETLTWSQVDLEARRLNLAKPGERATRKRRPIVPLSEAMVEELKAMKADSKNEWVLGSPASVYQAFERVALKAGLFRLPQRGMREAGTLSPHILRHSRATHLLQDGKAPWAVAGLLGDSLQTLLRVYAHACPDYMEGVVS